MVLDCSIFGDWRLLSPEDWKSLLDLERQRGRETQSIDRIDREIHLSSIVQCYLHPQSIIMFLSKRLDEAGNLVRFLAIICNQFDSCGCFFCVHFKWHLCRP